MSILYHYYFSIFNDHSSVAHVATVTVNSRTGSDEDKSRKRRDTDYDYDQAYGMRAYVNGKSNFTFSDSELYLYM